MYGLGQSGFFPAVSSISSKHLILASDQCEPLAAIIDSICQEEWVHLFLVMSTLRTCTCAHSWATISCLSPAHLTMAERAVDPLLPLVTWVWLTFWAGCTTLWFGRNLFSFIMWNFNSRTHKKYHICDSFGPSLKPCECPVPWLRSDRALTLIKQTLEVRQIAKCNLYVWTRYCQEFSLILFSFPPRMQCMLYCRDA